MLLNIITPCSRPLNLKAIAESINIPRENYRWIVVFDFPIPPDQSVIPDNCEWYCHQMQGSIVGHAQRNFAMSIVDKGHIYFNDDDTCIHPDLWENIKNCGHNDFISFPQLHKQGGHRIEGNVIDVGGIDSHNFIVSHEIAKNFQFNINQYEADGIFAKDCYGLARSRFYTPTPLSVYNLLRD